MSRKKLFEVVAVVGIGILAASLAFHFIRFRETQSSWLARNDFIVYKQDFAWAGGNATEYMFWNVTALNGDLADLNLVSHGVNISNGTVSFPETDINVTVTITSREVVGLSNLTSEMPVGSKWPFWIPASVKVGDPVQTAYGDSFISPSQPVDIMGRNRDCWVVSYNYAHGSSMNRFYDTASGICLKIQSYVVSDGISVAVNETAVQTNINLP